MRGHHVIAAASIALLATLGCGINSSYTIDDGTHLDHAVFTVNGTIAVGSDCRIRGRCQTVNGWIEIADNTEVRELQTVNGHIDIGAKCTVDGDVQTVNGSVRCGRETTVDGDARTVNGTIRLDGARVTKDVSLTNGDVHLDHGASVAGDITVSGNHSHGSKIDITIGQDCVVGGNVRVNGHATVRVVLIGNGAVKGDIRGAEVIRKAPAKPDES